MCVCVCASDPSTDELSVYLQAEKERVCVCVCVCCSEADPPHAEHALIGKVDTHTHTHINTRTHTPTSVISKEPSCFTWKQTAPMLQHRLTAPDTYQMKSGRKLFHKLWFVPRSFSHPCSPEHLEIPRDSVEK